MRIIGPDGKWYVGGFDTEPESEIAETRLVQIQIEGATPPIVLAAVAHGTRLLNHAPGHYTIQVFGGPNAEPRVDFTSGGRFKTSA